MRDFPLGPFILSFAFLGAALLLFYLRWLPKGKAGAVLLFLAGAGVVGSLYAGGIPPAWFEGGWEGFGLMLFLLAWAFVSDKGEARSFGRPLLLGMSAVLLVTNVWAHV